MRTADEKMIEARPEEYQAAKAAALLELHKDRRWLGATKLREAVAELGALTAMAGEGRSLGRGTLQVLSDENVKLYIEGLEQATNAAAKALSKFGEVAA